MSISGDEQSIKLAKGFATAYKFVRLLIAFVLIVGWLGEYSWLKEAVIVSLVILLIASMGFFDVFIQELVEYNAASLEKRQILNASEANLAFERLERRIGSLESQATLASENSDR